MELTDEELHLVRQWFESVEDTNRVFLNKTDYALAIKIYENLGMKVYPRLIEGRDKPA
ncbi:hypothetical protein [Aeromonas sp. L_1B5_3]|uniref:hypothetical protein n=1 Tax=Aeromonas sp. L_1B5_3 TaxID=1588629 RepID=UPI000A4B1A56|nr:hypothetical protein [Aeromonas sp. L_1B5_3]